ncbi:MAG: hypothetical protein GX915_03535 [Clostridiales bacterium]|nr:hypothetical protein [Clostridiales bacterium]
MNAGIAQVTENKSSFMISINSSALQLGSAIGSRLAALVISLFGIQNIAYITILSYLVIAVIQLNFIKKIQISTYNNVCESRGRFAL